jgi:site-specific recombinase XerD
MKRELSRLVSSDPFDRAVMLALVEISAVDTTRREYRRDFDLWRTFCGEVGVDATAPQDGAVAAWVEWMKRQGHASKSRARRMSALSSIYRELRRKKVVAANPFSVDEGPRREKVSVDEPTQVATPEMVRTLLAACDETPLGLRDAAMIRVLWSTGMRRVSLLSMTSERLQKDHMGYVATVTKKGGDNQRVLICGKARDALDRWLAVLKEGGLASGPIWRTRSGKPLELRELNRAIERRGAGVSPHMLRVAFLTYNPAGLEAKQEAAGHSDPATTRLYDRASWRGREAFERMPEIEDVK